MMHPKNSSYASSAQSLGHKIGSLISSSFFIAFNDIEFCNNYIYSTPQKEPLLSIPRFIYIWAFFQCIITLYIAFFITEKKAQDSDDEEEELTIMPSQIFSILKDICFNRNLIYYFVFVMITTPSF